MKRLPTQLLLALLVLVCLADAACGTSSAGTSTGRTTPSGASSSTSTGTAVKNRATSVPVASAAECGRLLSISEANQFTNPVRPATKVVPVQSSSGGFCFYETPRANPIGIPQPPYLRLINVGLVFEAYIGGTFSASVQNYASGILRGVAILSTEPVSGIGDQALYMTARGLIPPNTDGSGADVTENILFVVDGLVAFGVIHVVYNLLNIPNPVDPLGSASTATVLSDSEQIARIVISRL